jgi:hypothetical protein
MAPPSALFRSSWLCASFIYEKYSLKELLSTLPLTTPYHNPGRPLGAPQRDTWFRGPNMTRTGTLYIPTPMTFRSRLSRFIAIAFATIQIVAIAGAPALEAALTIRTINAVTADQNTPDRNVPSHDPSTCVVCQLINSIATPPERETIFVAAGESIDREHAPVDVPREHQRRADSLSRAPPSFPA